MNKQTDNDIEKENDCKEKENIEEDKERRVIEIFGDVYMSSFGKFIKSQNEQNKMNNVAIFVDYDNVYWTLMNYYNHDPDNEDPSKNLFSRLWERYGHRHVRTFRAYADFQLIRTNLTSLQKKRIQIRHVYSNDKKGEQRKNSSDIELCIDAIETTYKEPDISCYVIVTADSDMIPLLSRLRYKGKKVELYYLPKAAPKHVDITHYADVSFDLIEFLNIEDKEYNLQDFIVPALIQIDQWEEEYRNDNRYYLGKPYLRDAILGKALGLPSNVCSELIELLFTKKYIHMINKPFIDGEYKQSISLTDDGEKLIIAQKEAAPAIQEKTSDEPLQTANDATENR